MLRYNIRFLKFCSSPFGNKSYYEILGVSKSTSDSDIKKAFHENAKKYHPDRGGSSASSDKFRAIFDAYKTLKDPVKRREYDQNMASGGTQFNARSGSANSGYNAYSHHTSDYNYNRSGFQRHPYSQYTNPNYNSGFQGRVVYINPFTSLIRFLGIILFIRLIFGLLTDRAADRREELEYDRMKAIQRLERERERMSNTGEQAPPVQQLVFAYYNPITRVWCHIPDGFDAPSGRALFDYAQQKRPKEYDAAVANHNVQHVEQLNTAYVPRQYVKDPWILFSSARLATVEYSPSGAPPDATKSPERIEIKPRSKQNNIPQEGIYQPQNTTNITYYEGNRQQGGQHHPPSPPTSGVRF